MNCYLANFKSLESEGDAPLLFGLKDMQRMGMIYDATSYTIRCGDSLIPVIRDRGHLFIRWNPSSTSTFFTLSELTNLHVRYGHPGWEMLHSFLLRASPDELDSEAKSHLRNIEKACRSCQHIAVPPRTFKVRVPHEHLQFNAEVLVDLFWLNGKPCLSVMDRDTKYTSASFVRNQTVSGVWEAIQRCWILRYLGPPSSLRHDAGVKFLTPKLYSLAAAQGITCHPIPIEHPQALGIGERYHAVIRRLFQRIKQDLTSISDEYALDAALKALNDTMGIDGLTPTLLVYSVHPKLSLPGSHGGILNQKDRMAAQKLALDEYAKILDEQRLRIGKSSRSPTVVEDLVWGELVVVYRKTTGKWEGPVRFISSVPQGYYIEDTHGKMKLFAKPCVQRYATGLSFDDYVDPILTLSSDADISEDRLRPTDGKTLQRDGHVEQDTAILSAPPQKSGEAPHSEEEL